MTDPPSASCACDVHSLFFFNCHYSSFTDLLLLLLGSSLTAKERSGSKSLLCPFRPLKQWVAPPGNRLLFFTPHSPPWASGSPVCTSPTPILPFLPSDPGIQRFANRPAPPKHLLTPFLLYLSPPSKNDSDLPIHTWQHTHLAKRSFAQNVTHSAAAAAAAAATLTNFAV